MMNTASHIHPMSTPATTRPSLTAMSATTNLKLHTQAAPTSLLHQLIKPILRQISMLLNQKAPTTRTLSTTLQTTLRKARTRLMNRPEVHMARAMPL
jgi:hypothetical protein